MGAMDNEKKYIDDIFTIGHGSLYASDGRSRSDASKKNIVQVACSKIKIHVVVDMECTN